MEKKLIKKLAINYLFIGTIFVFLFSLIIYEKGKSVILNNCDEILNQIENSYEYSRLTLDEKLHIYKEDYINRVYATDFILQKHNNINDKEHLIKTAELMGFNSINLVDYSGVIVLSSQECNIGLNLLENQDTFIFEDLIKGNTLKDEILGLDCLSEDNTSSKLSFGVKSSMEEYSMLLVTLENTAVIRAEAEESIGALLKNTPTSYTTAIFAIDATSGDILGITPYNDQTLDFDGVKSKEELLSLLNSLKEGKIVKINGSYKFAKSILVDDFILLCTKDSNTLVYNVLVDIFFCFTISSFILLAFILILKKHLHGYIFSDFKQIENNIKRVLTGKLNTTFHTNISEMESLINTLNNWKDHYRNRTNKLSKLMNNIDSHIAIFECSYYVKTNFFSSNLRSILGVNDIEWEEISKSPMVFESYIQGLLSLANDKGIIHINNRYLSIISSSTDFEFFGLIIDKSFEIANNRRMVKELKRAKSDAEKDDLTTLLNRNAFKISLEKLLDIHPLKGVLLILDLDNFKKVNDNLGHPEGDKVLKLVSSVLKRCFHRNLVGRLGGDEFLVFLNEDLSMEALRSTLDELLHTVKQDLSFYYENYQVSISIGAAYVDSKCCTPENLYKKADEALYVAKEKGKDIYHINDPRGY